MKFVICGSETETEACVICGSEAGAIKMRVRIGYDLATHSYKLKRTKLNTKINDEENCIETTYEQWLKHNRIRREFLEMQEWIIKMQVKRSEEFEKEVLK